MPALKVLRRENTGVVYASTTKPDLTVRFRGAQQNKSLGSIATTNFLQEIIVNDHNEVTVGATTAKDPVSVRVRVSAAKESKTRVSALLAALATQLTVWDGEGVFQGFDPDTAPTI